MRTRNSGRLQVQRLAAVTLLVGAALSGAGCGGDGSSPATPAPAPEPPPLQALAWQDVPEEALAIAVGEQSVVELRLTAAVEATYTVSATNESIAVSSESPRVGVVQVAVTGLEAGESEVTLRAEASGYQVAEARFPVRVELRPLVWQDIPEDTVTMELGQREHVSLRLAPAIEAAYSVSATNANVTVSAEESGVGTVEVVVTALGVGDSEVAIVATAAGYETAAASFLVRVNPQAGFVTEDPSFGCREFHVYESLIGYVADGRDEVFVDELTYKVFERECGFFDLGDAIEWSGEEMIPSSSSLLVGIRVWGSPQVGPDLLAAPRSEWWTPRVFTTFAESTVTYTDVGPLILEAIEQSRAAVASSAAR